MLDIAKIVLFISACTGLFGLTLFLFRDQITRSRTAGQDAVEDRRTSVVVMPITGPDAIEQQG
jgi:hypothetical protein